MKRDREVRFPPTGDFQTIIQILRKCMESGQVLEDLVEETGGNAQRCAELSQRLVGERLLRKRARAVEGQPAVGEFEATAKAHYLFRRGTGFAGLCSFDCLSCRTRILLMQGSGLRIGGSDDPPDSIGVPYGYDADGKLRRRIQQGLLRDLERMDSGLVR